MATREDTLKLGLEITGAEDAKKLTSAIDALEKEFADAGPEAKAMIDELRKLGELASQASGFTKLKAQIHDTGDALALAKMRAAELQREIDGTDEPTARLTREFERAKKAVADLAATQNRQTAELQRSSNAIAAAGLSTAKLAEAQRDINQRMQDTAAGMQRFASSAESAGKSSTSLGSSLSSLRGILAGLGVYLSFQTAIQGVRNILEVGDAAERARLQLAQLYGSAEAGNAAFERLRDLARENGQSFASVLDAARRLKAVGLDPLDGTLQALIDQTALLGGSQETLTSIGLALGQMWAKQKLQTEEILQLVERGVPAFDLLAKVTGKSGAELSKLIESGKLGRKEIKALIDEIARSAEGAAAQNLNTLSGLVLQLRERFNEFLETIADSGAMDYFKGKLIELRDTITTMAENGDLEQWAKDIATGITSTGQVLTGFANSVALVFNGFMTAVHGAAAGIATAIGAVVKAIAYMKELDFGDKLNASFAGVRSEAEQLHAVADALFESAKSNYDSTGAAAAALAKNFEALAGATEAAGSSATDTAPKIGDLAGGVKLTDEQLKAARAQFESLPLWLQRMVGPALEAKGVMTGLSESTRNSAAAFREQQEALVAARERVEAARAALVALAQSGDANADAFTKANAELQAAEANLRRLSAQSNTTAADTAKLADALQALGIKSQAELDALTQKHREAMEVVRAAYLAGQATIEDVTRAFERYAQTARAAVADSSAAMKQQVEQQLAAEAAANNLTIALERTGEAGKQASAAVADGFDTAADRIENAADSAEKLSEAADGAADSLDRMQGSADGAAVAIVGAGAGLGYMTEEARQAVAAAQGFDGIRLAMLRYQDQIFATREELDEFTRSQQEAAEAATKAAEEIDALIERLEDERAQATLGKEELENRRFQKELERIRELEEASNYSATAQAARLRALAEAEHRRRLEEIAEEERARNGHSGGSSSSSSGASNTRPEGSGRPSSTGGASVTVNITGGLFFGEDGPRASQALARMVKTELDRMARLSG